MPPLGIFGGSFNPIHIGHTAIAEAALKQFNLDKILFIVANIQPLKSPDDLAPFRDRIEMVKLAVSGNKNFEVSDIEGKRGDVSYTVDTLKELKDEYGEESKLYLIIGGDSVKDLHRWREPDKILEMAELIIYPRGDFSREDFFTLVPFVSLERFPDVRKNILTGELHPESGTEIRRRLAAGEPADDMLNPAVLEYIHKNKLYTKV